MSANLFKWIIGIRFTSFILCLIFGKDVKARIEQFNNKIYTHCNVIQTHAPNATVLLYTLKGVVTNNDQHG
jgi:hypothetical protein